MCTKTADFRQMISDISKLAKSAHEVLEKYNNGFEPIAQNLRRLTNETLKQTLELEIKD